MQTGISPSKTKQSEPTDSCVVEPFYVPVNSRIKNKDSKNFWDDGLDEPYSKKSLNNSTLNGSGQQQQHRRATSAMAMTPTNAINNSLKEENSRNGRRLNKT